MKDMLTPAGTSQQDQDQPAPVHQSVHQSPTSHTPAKAYNQAQDTA